MRIFNRIFKKIRYLIYNIIDNLYLPIDKSKIRRAKNIKSIPFANGRYGGKLSYAEWSHVIGVFQSLIHYVVYNEKLKMLDVGCGTGLVGIAAKPFLQNGGSYTGLDVNHKNIEFCKKHFDYARYNFIHLDANNPFYNKSQNNKFSWSLDDESFDLVTALSVWTHMNEEDALFYFKEINRVLKVGGKAIVTFFLLDAEYDKFKEICKDLKISKFHNTSPQNWIFKKPVYNSEHWYAPEWANPPEKAIGITVKGFNKLCNEANLTVFRKIQGNWKEGPGLYFQDIVILEK